MRARDRRRLGLLIIWVASWAPGAAPAQSRAVDPAVARLIEGLKKEDEQERWAVSLALARLGTPAIPAVLEAVDRGDERVRSAAINALRLMQPFPRDVLPRVIDRLKYDPGVMVIRSAADALAETRLREAREAVPRLKELVQHEDWTICRSAIDALRQIDPKENAIEAMIGKLRAGPSGLRRSAADALAARGPEARSAVAALIEVLRDRESLTCFSAARALGKIGPDALEAIHPHLTALLKHADERVRVGAVTAIDRIGPRSEDSIEALVAGLKDPTIRDPLIEALVNVGPGAVPALEAARASEDWRISQSANEALRRIHSSTWPPYLIWFAVVAAGYALAIATCLLLYWKWPRLLLGANERFDSLGEWLAHSFGRAAPDADMSVAVPTNVGKFDVSVRLLLVFGIFRYGHRVLDAWVASHLDGPASRETARDRFEAAPTVRERAIHVPIPIALDGRGISELTAVHLQPAFAKGRVCLLIHGEGGAGKTSLACELARWAMHDDPARRLSAHRMLPVLIETELDPDSQGKPSFLGTIRRQLRGNVGDKDVPKGFLKRLLSEGRVLVIVDGLTEMSKVTVAAIGMNAEEPPGRAIIVTSRTGVTPGKAQTLAIESCPLVGAKLSSFLQTYLESRGRDDLVTGPGFHDACGRLSRIVRDRGVNVMFAKMYADLMAKTAATKAAPPDPGDDLPNDIRELLLCYLNEINRKVSEERKRDDTHVQRDAMILAKEMLSEAYRPSPIPRRRAIEALGGPDAETRLVYLEDGLHLVRRTPPKVGDQIAFAIDPLAEYLAGFQIAETHAEDPSLWREFLDRATDLKGRGTPTEGFLTAVWDCCHVRGWEERIPEEVRRRIGELAGLTPEADSRPAAVADSNGHATSTPGLDLRSSLDSPPRAG